MYCIYEPPFLRVEERGGMDPSNSSLARNNNSGSGSLSLLLPRSLISNAHKYSSSSSPLSFPTGPIGATVETEEKREGGREGASGLYVYKCNLSDGRLPHKIPLIYFRSWKMKKRV